MALPVTLRDQVLFVSLHRFGLLAAGTPFYPGTGSPSEVGGSSGGGDGKSESGSNAAVGRTINVGWRMGMGDAEYDAAFERVVPLAAA